MANAFYGKGKTEIFSGNVDFPGATINAILIDDTDYTVNLSTHQDLADVAAGARIDVITLAGVTVTDTGGTMTLDANDFTFTGSSVDAGDSMIIYLHTGTESTSTLLINLDTFSAGMPVDLDDGNAEVTVNGSGLATW